MTEDRSCPRRGCDDRNSARVLRRRLRSRRLSEYHRHQAEAFDGRRGVEAGRASCRDVPIIAARHRLVLLQRHSGRDRRIDCRAGGVLRAARHRLPVSFQRTFSGNSRLHHPLRHAADRTACRARRPRSPCAAASLHPGQRPRGRLLAESRTGGFLQSGRECLEGRWGRAGHEFHRTGRSFRYRHRFARAAMPCVCSMRPKPVSG